MAEEQPGSVSVTVEKFPPYIGMMSCVGIGIRRPQDFPLAWGNYCSISGGPYLCNMWAENLGEWAQRNPDVKEIEITIVSHAGKSIGFVSDPRLKDWFNKRFCVTGNGWPSVAVMRKVAELLDLPPDWACGCERDDMAPSCWERFDKYSCVRTCYYCDRQHVEHFNTEGQPCA